MEEKSTKELLKEVHIAIVGNQDLGIPGMVRDIDKNKKSIEENTKNIEKVVITQKRAKWLSLGIGAGAGFGVPKLSAIILKLVALF